MDTIKSDKVLDTRGLTSPMPIRKMMHALDSLSIGKTLEIWCSDPDFQEDFKELCETECIRLLGRFDDPDGHARYFIQKTTGNDYP
ncbi:MAG: sulfurtransferase TusA family protein [Pseudomonadota bacterium]